MKERRNLVLTLLGIGVSGLGSNLYAFAISFYILSITGSASSFAISLVVSVLPRIVLNPLVGNIVDRVNKKMLVVLADALSGVVMFGLYMVSASSDLSIMYIYIGSFMLSVLQVFLNTSFVSSYASIVTQKYLTKLNSFSQTISALLQIGSPILGGIIYGVLDVRIFLLINGISFILSSLTECFIDFKFNSSLESATTGERGFIENFIEGYRYVMREKMFLSLALYAMAINFFMSTFSVILPYTLVTIHGYEPTAIGMIQATFPVGMLIASVVIGSKNIQFSKGLFATGITVMAVALSIFALPSMTMIDFGRLTPFYYGITFITLAGTAMLINIPLGVKVQSSVDEAYRGRFFGFLGTMSEGVMPIAYILVGFLISFIPTYVILFVSTGALILITIHIRNNETLNEQTVEEKVTDGVQITT